jgi:hypothetical protein
MPKLTESPAESPKPTLSRFPQEILPPYPREVVTRYGTFIHGGTRLKADPKTGEVSVDDSAEKET